MTPFGPSSSVAPPAPPAQREGSLASGDLCYDPFGLGRNVVLQVVSTVGPLTFVTGDVFDKPEPYPTAHLQKLTVQETIREAQRMVRTAEDLSILRLQMLKEGVERLSPAVLAVGGMTLLLTYNALKGLVEKVLNERTQAQSLGPDYDQEYLYFQG